MPKHGCGGLQDSITTDTFSLQSRRSEVSRKTFRKIVANSQAKFSFRHRGYRTDRRIHRCKFNTARGPPPYNSRSAVLDQPPGRAATVFGPVRFARVSCPRLRFVRETKPHFTLYLFSVQFHVGVDHRTTHHDASHWRWPPTKAPAASPPQRWARITAGERKQSPPPQFILSNRCCGDARRPDSRCPYAASPSELRCWRPVQCGRRRAAPCTRPARCTQSTRLLRSSNGSPRPPLFQRARAARRRR